MAGVSREGPFHIMAANPPGRRVRRLGAQLAAPPVRARARRGKGVEGQRAREWTQQRTARRMHVSAGEIDAFVVENAADMCGAVALDAQTFDGWRRLPRPSPTFLGAVRLPGRSSRRLP